MGFLRVEADNYRGFTELQTISGDQGTGWNKFERTINNFQQAR